MSCIECEKIQDTGDIAYFRWENANIGLIGCDKHLREIFAVLENHRHLTGNMVVEDKPVFRVLRKPVKTDLF